MTTLFPKFVRFFFVQYCHLFFKKILASFPIKHAFEQRVCITVGRSKKVSLPEELRKEYESIREWLSFLFTCENQLMLALLKEKHFQALERKTAGFL